MESKDIIHILNDVRDSTDKQLAIAKHNIINQISRIVNKIYNGTCTIDDARHSYLLSTIPFTPEKQKDQTFHRLNISLFHNDKHKGQTLVAENNDAENYLSFNEAINLLQNLSRKTYTEFIDGKE